jgi:Zn-dependent protease with chaperone function
MSIHVTCGHCEASLRVNESMAGKRGKCPRCGRPVDVAAPQAAPPTEAPAAAPRAAPQRTATVEADPASLRREAASAVTPRRAAAAERPPAAAVSREQLQQQILTAFTGDIPPVRRPPFYSLAVLLSAGVMVLLPAIYVGLILLAIFGVYWHAVYDVGMLSAEIRGRGYILVLAAYVAPMIVGAILVMFMIKPLFARPASEGRRRSLTRDGEPLLFAFVDRICQAVHAPVPRRIDVDCQVNASASFRRGMISFLGSDLVLTIGIPLVAGLNLRQFAGVLAHEFGHFSQGAGMRLSYVVRTIAYWFHRVVYERDNWDEWLHETARSIDLRIGWMLYLAQFFVWLTRKILFVLMLVAHAVAGVLLREMEFDADRHEARMGGSDTFETTTRRMTVLNIAMNGAQSDLGQFFREGRLADNLPKLMAANVQQIPGKVMRQIQKSIDESRTGWLDTHPCDRDRIANAAKENAPGVFRLDSPARLLFRNFDDVARKVTWDFYRGILGPKLKPSDLHPVEDLIGRQEKDQDAFKALNRFFQGAFNVYRPVSLDGLNLIDQPSGSKAVTLLQQARTRIAEQLPAYTKVRDAWRTDAGKLVQSVQVVTLVGAGLKPPRHQFGTCPTDSLAASKFGRQASERMQDAVRRMADWESLQAQRLVTALSLLNHPRLAAKLDGAEQMREQLQRLLPAWKALQSTATLRFELQLQHERLAALCACLEQNAENEMFIRELLKQMGKAADQVNAIRDSVAGVTYPMDHAQADITLNRYLRSEPLLERENLQEVYHASENVVDKANELAARIAAQLTFMAEKVESALGLERLPEVADEEEDVQVG